MTTYKNTDYETAEALREAINTELSQLAYPYAVKHKVYGIGQLTFVKAPLLGSGLYATIEFATGTKTLSLDVVLASKLLEMPEILTDILTEAQLAYKADFDERQRIKVEAERLERAQALEAEKKAEAAKKAEEKYQLTKAKMIRDFEALTQAEATVNTSDEFYYSLGWLAKHAGAFSVALPDYLLSAFESHFGTSYKPTVVDSKKRTVNGNPMQWALSMKISLGKKVEGLVPTYLTKYLSKAGNAIADTSFVWDLVDNYGFQFGKTQDIDKIRSCIPSQYLSIFDVALV